MAVAHTLAVALSGVSGSVVEVEADLTTGLPGRAASSTWISSALAIAAAGASGHESRIQRRLSIRTATTLSSAMAV